MRFKTSNDTVAGNGRYMVRNVHSKNIVIIQMLMVQPVVAIGLLCFYFVSFSYSGVYSPAQRNVGFGLATLLERVRLTFQKVRGK